MSILNTIEFMEELPISDMHIQGDLTDLPDYFRVITAKQAYSATQIELFSDSGMKNPPVTFIVARGATGKTALAKELSKRTSAPLWNTSADLTISAYSLKMHLSIYLNTLKPFEEISKLTNPVVVIDGVDEAQVRVSTESWNDFKTSLVEYASAGLRFIILGRESATSDIAESFEESEIPLKMLELRPFNTDQGNKFLDEKFRNLPDANVHIINSKHYKESKLLILSAIQHQLKSAESFSTRSIEEFLGYAPVLEAIAIHLNSNKNISKLQTELQHDLTTGERVLASVVTAITKREQGKLLQHLRKLDEFKTLEESDFTQLTANVFDEEEQVSLIFQRMELANEPPLPPAIQEHLEDDYRTLRNNQIDEHPFLISSARPTWASKVFEGYTYFSYSEKISRPRDLVIAASKNPLFFSFAIALENSPILKESLIADEWFVSAIHASMIAFNSGKLGGAISPRSELSFAQILETGEGNHVYRVFYFNDNLSDEYPLRPSPNIDIEFLLEDEKILNFYGPLERISILSPRHEIRLKPIERAPEIGPGLTVVGDSIGVDKIEARLRRRSTLRRSPSFMIARRFDSSLPRIPDFKRELHEPIHLSTIESKPEDLPYPWRDFISTLPLDGVRGTTPPAVVDKFMRIVSELKVLRSQTNKNYGPQRLVWCAKVGLQKSSTNTDEILQILFDEGIIKEKNQQIFYVDDPAERPLFQTIYDVPPNSSTDFNQLSPEHQQNWLRILEKLQKVT